MMFRILSASLIVIFLCSCSSTGNVPDMHFYLLEESPSVTQDSTPENLKESDVQITIQLAAIQLPDYLKQRQLVTKLNSNQLEIANYHSWADDLGDSIQRVLIHNLNRQNNENRYVRFCRSCLQMAISIEHFYPTEQGQVVLSGSFTLHDKSSNQIQNEDFFFTEKLRADGYDNAVTQMRELLEQLSDQIN